MLEQYQKELDSLVANIDKYKGQAKLLIKKKLVGRQVVENIPCPFCDKDDAHSYASIHAHVRQKHLEKFNQEYKDSIHINFISIKNFKDFIKRFNNAHVTAQFKESYSKMEREKNDRIDTYMDAVKERQSSGEILDYIVCPVCNDHFNLKSKLGVHLHAKHSHLAELHNKPAISKFIAILYGDHTTTSELLRKSNAIDTSFEKYGFSHPCKNKEVKASIKSTTIERYGEDYWHNSTDGVGHYIPKIGKNEKSILDNIEIEFSITLERQYPVGRYFVDGYCIKTNKVYEVNESYHYSSSKQIKRDIDRQSFITEKLECEFIIIDDLD